MPGLQVIDASTESEERFRALAQAAWEGIAFTRDGVIIDANPQLAEILGYDLAELIGRPALDLVSPCSQAAVLRTWRLGATDAHEYRLLRKDGEVVIVEARVRTVPYRGELVRMAAVRDITERTTAVGRRRALVAGTAGASGHHFFRSLAKNLARALNTRSAFVGEIGPGDPGRIRSLSAWVDGAYAEPFDFPIAGGVCEDVLANGLRVHGDGLGARFPGDAALARLGAASFAGIPLYDSAGAPLGVLAVADDRRMCSDDDLVSTLRVFAARAGVELDRIRAQAQRHHAEGEVLALEAQLRHSQKLEAVGQLAGGIAHDFNNLLTVINGYCERLLAAAGQAEIKSDLELIHKAGQRAAGLTRQLLAFSRRQVQQPRVLDLNAIVTDIQRILTRVIGEQNTVITVLDPALEAVEADPGQVEQVMMNLAINARDAMPDGGTITIHTANVTVVEGQPSPFPLRPGRYVMLAIRDTGHGMDEGTASRVFEPFFTTKEAGKGTGLGLSTVYGIVAQSGGDIAVESAVGAGTTMRVFLPRVERRAPQAPAAVPPAPASGHETVLLVEDETFVRELVREFLRASGYTVIDACNAEEALQLVAAAGAPAIDLLVTDVVLPGLSGVRLAQQLKHQLPGLETLYMSGYPGDAMFRTDVFDPGPAFLAKPFTRHVLTQKVREILNSRPGSAVTAPALSAAS